ncbi:MULTISPECIES: serine O-acetyltransferase [unclassified Mucilaginibacter]|uniref:serine O-acetyltransferase n=1 Tax=unclassified Mucilaginibacter TaxID=2617802 RepID=UPI00138D62B1|nr:MULTISPECIES: hypothetical protein [unclassified Mucilaginibacter]MBB5396056.1 serine O-acetyltransferase [Mucilaginibacter sp. AK015]QHS54277.1 hypothetical protein GWR56_01435 [Mucilaginibacter sp. 14171R-50]
MVTLKATIAHIKSDIYNHGGVTFKKKVNVYLFNASFRLLLNYRIGRYLRQRRNFISNFILQRYEYRQVTKRNCYISFRASIGSNFRFAHPIGVIIGENVVIGDNVRIWQNVTLGSHGKKEQALIYPQIGNNVKIFAGAKLFGGITIGDGAAIGANAVVNTDVPANKTAVGIPAKVLGS